MSNISRLSEWHRKQIGTSETPPGSNNVIYNTRYYGREVSGDAYPWCMAYIWDGFQQLGLGALFCDGAKTAYCPYVVSWAQRNGRWFGSDYREGDILLYDWDRDGVADHVGYCLSASGSSVVSIEGNAGERVSKITRSVSAVMGAYRPEYGEDVTSAEKPATDATAAAWGVIRGEWGNGADRVNRLAAAGYDPAAVQAEVDRILTGAPAGIVERVDAPSNTAALTSSAIEQLAREVIRGEWGNGADRINRITEAVQAKVNELLEV